MYVLLTVIGCLAIAPMAVLAYLASKDWPTFLMGIGLGAVGDDDDHLVGRPSRGQPERSPRLMAAGRLTLLIAVVLGYATVLAGNQRRAWEADDASRRRAMDQRRVRRGGRPALTGRGMVGQLAHPGGLPPRLLEPGHAADYFAVYAYTIAWLLTAAVAPDPPRGRAAGPGPLAGDPRSSRPGAPWRGRQRGRGRPRDEGFGTLYVLGATVGGFGLLVVAAMFWPSPPRDLTFVPAVGALAMIPADDRRRRPRLRGLGRVRRDPRPRTRCGPRRS